MSRGGGGGVAPKIRFQEQRKSKNKVVSIEVKYVLCNMAEGEL